MRLSRNRFFKVNMGNYESYSFGATVEATHHDVGLSDEEAYADPDKAMQVITDWVMTQLNNQLVEEIQETTEVTEEQRSYLLRLLGEAPKPASRSKKTRRA